MDYEKKYKEALARAREIHLSNDEMEYLFPELKESEDEKIRKEILDCFASMKKQGCFPSKHKEQYDAWVAWLEKQKEYESTDFEYVWDRTDCGELTSALDKYSEEAIINMCHAWYDKGIELERKSWLEKQGEQKQEFNYPEFDSADILAIQCCMRTAEKVTEDKELYDKLLSLHSRLLDAYWIEKQSGKSQGKSALEAINEEKVDNANKVENETEIPYGSKDSELQEDTYYIPKGFHAEIDEDKIVIKKGEKPTAWSKKDEEILNLIIARLQSHPDVDLEEYSKEYDWLNSPKARSTWKPSDAQIKVLLSEVTGWKKGCSKQIVLESLYQDLKKL